MHVFVKEFLFFQSFCRFLIVFQLSVRTDRERELLSRKRTGVDRGRGFENWQKCADIWMTILILSQCCGDLDMRFCTKSEQCERGTSRTYENLKSQVV